MLSKQKISQKNLKKILAGFDLGKILKTKILATSGNSVVFLTTKSGKFILRLSPKKQPMFRDKEEILAEVELFAYLKKNNFPVAGVMADKKGNCVVNFNGQFGLLLEFIAGKEDYSPDLSKVRKAGEILGRLHFLTKNFKTKNKRKHEWGIETMKKYFPENKKKILQSNFKDKEKFIAVFEQALKRIRFPKSLPCGMIHEDLGKRHVLWKDNRVVGIIDFDRSYYGKLVLDLGQMCRGWCFTNHWQKWDEQNFKTLLHGYETNRRLTVLEKKYLKDAIEFAILERAMAFCLKYIDKGQDPADGQYARHSVFKLLLILEKNKNSIEQMSLQEHKF